MNDDDKMKALNAKGQELKALSIIARANSLGLSGKQFGGDRDLYESCGWARERNWETYNQQYRFGGIAKTIINIKPEDTWRGEITVSVPTDEEGNKDPNAELFQHKFDEISKRVRLKEYFLRGDKLAGIGQYSVMRLGLKEPSTPTDPAAQRDAFASPVQSATDLLYVSVFSQNNADIAKINDDSTDKRFGEVKQYKLTESTEHGNRLSSSSTRGVATSSGKTVVVDASRCVHIAENLLEDEIYGTPRLEASLNYLFDLQKVTGGSAEMYWRGAFPGFSFELDPEAELDTQALEDMNAQIDNMIMGLKRYIKTQGLKVNQLAPQVVSPEQQIDVLMSQIAGTSRIPKRILIGSERGELASSQDEGNWAKVIQSRRETDCDRWVRTLIDMLIEYGVLPAVSEYMIVWPDIKAEDKKEASEVAVNLARAIQAFTSGDGESILTLPLFLRHVLKFPSELVDKIEADIDEQIEDDEDNDPTGFGPGARSVIEEAVRRAARGQTREDSTGGNGAP